MKSKKKKDLPDYLQIGDEKIEDSLGIATKFNNFFINVGPSLSNNITSSGDRDFSSYLTGNVDHIFQFNPVENERVYKTIQNLTSKSSCGYDEVSTRLLKSTAPYITGILTVIINQSLVTGIFPDKLTIAKVIPLHKKGDSHIVDNNLPISLLPSISKIFEKIVFKDLYDYFLTKKLSYNSQYGFRQDHSTELASLEFIDRITYDLDNGKIPLAVFLDLSKAFDTLYHHILLKKLHHYGVRNNTLKWFSSYLSDRTQYVDINGTKSPLLRVTTGVPQGSVLGPLLFIIYMNDLHNASDIFHSILFADDTNLSSPFCAFDIPVTANESHALS